MGLVVERSIRIHTANLVLEDALANIEQTGGNHTDADIILGYFGLIGEWIKPLLERVRNGIATAMDAITLREQMLKWERR